MALSTGAQQQEQPSTFRWLCSEQEHGWKEKRGGCCAWYVLTPAVVPPKEARAEQGRKGCASSLPR